MDNSLRFADDLMSPRIGALLDLMVRAQQTAARMLPSDRIGSPTERVNILVVGVPDGPPGVNRLPALTGAERYLSKHEPNSKLL
jgi:hypothetical protein